MGLDYNYPVINWKADFIFLETVNNVDPRESVLSDLKTSLLLL